MSRRGDTLAFVTCPEWVRRFGGSTASCLAFALACAGCAIGVREDFDDEPVDEPIIDSASDESDGGVLILLDPPLPGSVSTVGNVDIVEAPTSICPNASSQWLSVSQPPASEVLATLGRSDVFSGRFEFSFSLCIRSGVGPIRVELVSVAGDPSLGSLDFLTDGSLLADDSRDFGRFQHGRVDVRGRIDEQGVEYTVESAREIAEHTASHARLGELGFAGVRFLMPSFGAGEYYLDDLRVQGRP